jgi:hypothetical protein
MMDDQRLVEGASVLARPPARNDFRGDRGTRNKDRRRAGDGSTMAIGAVPATDTVGAPIWPPILSKSRLGDMGAFPAGQQHAPSKLGG